MVVTEQAGYTLINVEGLERGAKEEAKRPGGQPGGLEAEEVINR